MLFQHIEFILWSGIVSGRSVWIRTPLGRRTHPACSPAKAAAPAASSTPATAPAATEAPAGNLIHIPGHSVSGAMAGGPACHWSHPCGTGSVAKWHNNHLLTKKMFSATAVRSNQFPRVIGVSHFGHFNWTHGTPRPCGILWPHFGHTQSPPGPGRGPKPPPCPPPAPPLPPPLPPGGGPVPSPLGIIFTSEKALKSEKFCSPVTFLFCRACRDPGRRSDRAYRPLTAPGPSAPPSNDRAATPTGAE